MDYDVLVVGGGIQGVGVAQAAAARGHSVLLVERRSLAAETSSRSSKLIHGGLRYLESGQFRLVRESLNERATLLAIAPHLVRLVPFHIPVRRGARRGRWTIHAGLQLYAMLGGWRRASRYRTLRRSEWSALEGLRLDDVVEIFEYQDGQTDDRALTEAVMASARELGAEQRLHCTLERATWDDEGVTATIRSNDGEETLRVGCLVNAAGPWVREVAQRLTPETPLPEIDWVAGTHVELDGPSRPGITYLEHPDDGRGIFVMPWKGHTLIGTTERVHHSLDEPARPTQQEVDSLQRAWAFHYPDRPWSQRAAWSGLRVLPRGVGAAFHRSRDVMLMPCPVRQPRLLHVCGGKLTGYRHTAARVLDALELALPHRPHRADTHTLRLPDLQALPQDSAEQQPSSDETTMAQPESGQPASTHPARKN